MKVAEDWTATDPPGPPEPVIPAMADLALLFALVLRPLVRALQKLRLPEALAAAIVVGGLLAITANGIYFLAEPAMRWVENAPKTLREVERKVSGLKHSIATVQRDRKSTRLNSSHH